jgi:hypothetical protein
MRRTSLLSYLLTVGALTAIAAALAIPAQATPPTHFSEPVNFSFPLSYFTNVCGFPVYQSLVGTLNTTLRYDKAGSIVSEVDTQPGTTVTFSSPASGKSFSFPFSNIAHTDYTNGGALGSTATSSGSGLQFDVPGLPPDAGRVVFVGVVVAHTPGGVPIVAFAGVASASGRVNDPDVEDAAICAALAPWRRNRRDNNS